jgi:radical SAM-linked protein
MRCLERTLRRAALPMAHSQGFNPRPKVSFPLALGLGIEGRRELVELELAEPMEPQEVLRRLTAVAPPGFDFLEAEAAGPGRLPAVIATRYALEVPPGRRDAARAAVSALLSAERWPYTRRRPDRTIEADLRPLVLDANLDEPGILHLRLKVAPEGSARPEEVVEALGLADLLNSGAVLSRTEVELSPDVSSPPPEAPPAP